MMTPVSKIFLFSLLNAISLFVSADDFTVGEITVPRGEQVSGFITVPEGIDEGIECLIECDSLDQGQCKRICSYILK